MIKTFKDKTLEKIYKQEKVPKITIAVQQQTLKKLIMIDAATCLEDLKVPPGNRLEKLNGDRKGQYSIRVNDQYRICFTIQDSNYYDLEMVDYH